MRDLLEPDRSADDGRPTPPPERIVYVPMPRSAAAPRVSPALQAPTSSPPAARPQRAKADSSSSSGGPATVPIAPPTSRQRDSTPVPLVSAPAARSTAVTDPRVLFPTAGCDLACQLRHRTAGGGAGVGDGEWTTAQRDSMLREAARRARDAQRQPTQSPVGPTPPSIGAPVQQQGGSVGVPLPGGGPSAAERKRARELDAEISARLARIKARADSAQRARDSAEKGP